MELKQAVDYGGALAVPIRARSLFRGRLGCSLGSVPAAIALLFLALLFPAAVHSDRFINPITDVCWECLFPITVCGMNVTQGYIDLSKSHTKLCVCSGVPPKVGIPLTFWEPLHMMEVTRHAYKLVGLGGLSIGRESIKNRGSVAVDETALHSSFYHVHWYHFPLMSLLGIFEDFACVETGGLELGYFSELDPLWSDDRLFLVLHPEAALFGNILAQTACVADCLAASSGKALDELFWCAGCEGSLYPFTGTVPHHVGALQASALLIHRLLAKLHRCRLIKGYPKGEFCQAKYLPIIKKSLYKTQLVRPRPQRKGPCQPLGKSDLLWGLGKSQGGDEGGFCYLIWAKRHCCLDALKTTGAGVPQ